MEASQFRLPASQSSLTSGNSLQLQVSSYKNMIADSETSAIVRLKVNVPIGILYSHNIPFLLIREINWAVEPRPLLVALMPPVMWHMHFTLGNLRISRLSIYWLVP